MSMACRDGSVGEDEVGNNRSSSVDADNQWQPPRVIPFETLPSAHWSLKPGNQASEQWSPSHAEANWITARQANTA